MLIHCKDILFQEVKARQEEEIESLKSELQEITNRIAKLTKNIEKAKTAKEQVWIVLHVNTSMDKCLIYQIIDCADFAATRDVLNHFSNPQICQKSQKKPYITHKKA